MLRFKIAVAAVIAAAAAGLAGATDDAVRARVDTARERYEAEIARYRLAVKQLFDTREEAARKDGNKKLVDQVKLDRKTYEDTGILPARGAAALAKQRDEALAAVQTAYAAAVKEYTKAKRDDLAAALEKELDTLRAGVTPELVRKGTRFAGELTYAKTKYAAVLTVTEARPDPAAKAVAFEAVLEWDVGLKGHGQLKMAGERRGEKLTMTATEVLKGTPFFPVAYSCTVAGTTIKGTWQTPAKDHRGTLDVSVRPAADGK